MKKLMVCLALLLTPGCAVVFSPWAAIGGSGPYAWTGEDLVAASGKVQRAGLGWLVVFGIVDLPFALVMDTLCLPVAIACNGAGVGGGGEPAPAVGEEIFDDLDLDEHPRVVATVGEVESWKDDGRLDGNGWPTLLVHGTRGDCRVTVYHGSSERMMGVGVVRWEDQWAGAELVEGDRAVDLFPGKTLPASSR